MFASMSYLYPESLKLITLAGCAWVHYNPIANETEAKEVKANATCQKCGTKWYLAPGVSGTKCDRKIGRKKCGGRVVRK